MYYFNNEYLKEQMDKLIITDEERIVEKLEINDRQNLFIFLLDIKNSVSLPKEISKSIIDNLCLIAATDASSRGGIVFKKTDGIEAFFKNGFKAIQTAMSLYHRKQSIREKIFMPIIDNQYSMDSEGPPVNWHEIDFRVCLFRYPMEIINEILSKSNNNKMLGENLKNYWNEAVTRFNNKESFLITKQMYDSLIPPEGIYNNDSLLNFFDTNVNIPFAPKKQLGDTLKEFFGDFFYQYSNNNYRPVDLVEADLTEIDSAEKQEEIFIKNFKKKKEFYSNNYEIEKDPHLFEYFKIESSFFSHENLKAVVFGDINLDYITFLQKDSLKNTANGHIQIKHDIKKQIAGKGINIAKSLTNIEKFEPILLVGKLGMDLEMHNIVQELKKYPSIKPLLFLSSKFPTGTSICIRKKDENSSILTITDKPNANSDLTLPELEYRFDEIISCNYFFISGYCLLDKRIEIIKELINRIKDLKNKKIVLEFSPRNLWCDWFAKSAYRQKELKSILKHVFLIIYESGVFPKDDEDKLEDKLTEEIDYKVKINPDFKRMFKKVKNENKWEELPSIDKKPEKSLGLINKLTAEFINDEFLKPKILLCSKSPRRFNLLSSIYGKSCVLHYKADSPEFRIKEFNTIDEVKIEIINIALNKLISSINLIAMGRNEKPGKYREIKVAISSDLVVIIHEEEDNKFIVLDKPDNASDPIIKAKECLSKNLSNKTHYVLTSTCFLNFGKFIFSKKTWNKNNLKDCIEYLKNITSPGIDTINADFIDSFESRGNLCHIKNLPIVGKNNNEINTLHILLGKSEVNFRNINENELEEYIASGEWRTKAGGYAIQGNGAYFVDNIKGLFTNIVGFPVKEIVKIFSDEYGLKEPGDQK